MYSVVLFAIKEAKFAIWFSKGAYKHDLAGLDDYERFEFDTLEEARTYVRSLRPERAVYRVRKEK